MPPPQVALFVSNQLKLSSYHSNDINVNYDFEFIPSYTIFKNGSILLDFNMQKFRHINKSYPEAECKLNIQSLVDYCTVNEANITVKLKEDVQLNSIIQIYLIKVKNPDFVGKTQSSDIYIQAVSENGFKINEGYFSQIVYK